MESGVLHLDHSLGGSQIRAVVTDLPSGGFSATGWVGRAAGGSTGSNNIGMVVGNVAMVFHPGYTPTPGAFRFESLTSNVSMGFVPAEGILHEMNVIVTPDGANWRLDVTITDGANSNNVFQASLTVSAATIGTTIGQVGFRRSGGGGGDGIFDNLRVTDDVDAKLRQVVIEARVGGRERRMRLRLQLLRRRGHHRRRRGRCL